METVFLLLYGKLCLSKLASCPRWLKAGTEMSWHWLRSFCSLLAHSKCQTSLVCSHTAQHALLSDRNGPTRCHWKPVAARSCSFPVSSLAIPQESCVLQLNMDFSSKSKVPDPRYQQPAFHCPQEQPHLGKLSVPLLPRHFSVLVGWEELLRGMVTMAKHLIKEMYSLCVTAVFVMVLMQRQWALYLTGDKYSRGAFCGLDSYSTSLIY